MRHRERAINVSHFAQIGATANRDFTSWAARPMSRRISEHDIIFDNSADNASAVMGRTKSPSTPGRTMEAGPDGQSKLTTGRPHSIASISASGCPSKREDRTKMLQC